MRVERQASRLRGACSLLALLLLFLPLQPASAASESSAAVAKEDWAFKGVFGRFDKATLRRGYEVYDQVCAACHSMKYLHFRNLSELGYTKEQIKALAARIEVQDGPNNEGEFFSRTGKPFDRFPAPFANDEAARFANNGALPPDLSLITGARVGSTDYVYALLTQYRDPPSDVKLAEGQYYNLARPDGLIAMAPPLAEGLISYSDGTEASVDQMARDVATFLTWTTDPTLERRKRMGVKVMIFLFGFLVIAILYKRRVWSGVSH